MKRIVISVIVCTIALFVAFVLVNQKNNRPVANTQQLDMRQIAPLAPDFELPGVDGQSVRLSSLRGKVTILNFWATWCPPCREEIPSMNRLKHLLADSPIEIVAVNIEADGPQTVPLFMQQQPIAFTVLYDVADRVHKQYGVSKYPETFIIDKNGVVVEKVIGGTDWSAPQVVNYLKKLL